jgi:thiol-disulfide isomerase/thioredoxin
MMLHRRMMVAAAAGTLAVTALPRKPRAEGLMPMQEALHAVSPPADLPDAVFRSPDGAEHRLSDFKGHAMVVNLWATWCSPCVAEMPSLNALSKLLGPDDIAVMPVSSDRGGAATVQAWYQQHGITALPVLLDPKGALATAFGVRGIPTTILVDKSNQSVGRLEGAVDWAAPESVALIRKLTAG